MRGLSGHRIAVIGLGYVGLPLAVLAFKENCPASSGFEPTL